MNFVELVDVTIGRRIKKFRIQSGMTQESFCEKYSTKISIDKSKLSMLENGVKDNKKNPNFLTRDSITFFSKIMKKTESEFLFGDNNERKDLIKLMILNVFMCPNPGLDFNEYASIFGNNKANRYLYHPRDTQKEKDREKIRKKIKQNPPHYRFINPASPLDLHLYLSLPMTVPIVGSERTYNSFYYVSILNMLSQGDPKSIVNDPVFKLACSALLTTNPQNKKSNPNLKMIINDKLKEYDPFFYNYEYANLYLILMQNPSLYSESSSLILKCLFGNYNFCEWFFDKCRRYKLWKFDFHIFNQLNIATKGRLNLKEFKWSHFLSIASEFAVDYKGSGFPLFIDAFNEFFDLYSDKFLDFFNKRIFNIKVAKDINPLKVITNKYVEDIFVDYKKDSEFIVLLKEILRNESDPLAEPDNPIVSRRIDSHIFAEAMLKKYKALIMENYNRLANSPSKQSKYHKLFQRIDSIIFSLNNDDIFLSFVYETTTLLNKYINNSNPKIYENDNYSYESEIYNLSQYIDLNDKSKIVNTLKPFMIH